MSLPVPELRARNIAGHLALHPLGGTPTARAHGVLEGAWVVEQTTDNGLCHTTFQGPHAEWRARQYARAVVLEHLVDSTARMSSGKSS